MYLTEVIIIAIGLSMDSFAVSLASGLCKKPLRTAILLRAVLMLGLFQASFAALGWFIGQSMHHLIASFDHWVAFLLLAMLGTKIIYDSLRNGKSSQTFDVSDIFILLGLSVATSIDALVVGMGLGFLEATILESVMVIGAVTIIFAAAGFWVAKMFGLRVWGKRAEIIGGVVLIGIGIKILIEHLS
ncbi:MAG: manganese efflux pump MntP family protein [Bacteroidales bacterium]|nr:manganese efflux pump MntP family protein [Bacteroidales bacterium]MDZ4203329.1 manganese efflux pump MntP family protein [Bacteroidales bacterium]